MALVTERALLNKLQIYDTQLLFSSTFISYVSVEHWSIKEFCTLSSQSKYMHIPYTQAYLYLNYA
jgi:hypothetical protein